MSFWSMKVKKRWFNVFLTCFQFFFLLFSMHLWTGWHAPWHDWCIGIIFCAKAWFETKKMKFGEPVLFWATCDPSLEVSKLMKAVEMSCFKHQNAMETCWFWVGIASLPPAPMVHSTPTSYSHKHEGVSWGLGGPVSGQRVNLQNEPTMS